MVGGPVGAFVGGVGFSIVGAMGGTAIADSTYTAVRDYDYVGAKNGAKEVIKDAANFQQNMQIIKTEAKNKQQTINDMYDNWGK